MTGIFITILNMSIGASVCILAVMLLRLLLRSAPKIFSYLLWAVVLIRLVCPVLPEADFGLLPDMKLYEEAVPTPKEAKFAAYQMRKMSQCSLGMFHNEWQRAGSGGETVAISEGNIPQKNGDGNHLPEEEFFLDHVPPYSYGRVIHILAMGWALAAFGLMAYAVTGYGLFMRGIAGKKISTPFVAGLIHPAIYLPDDLDDVQKQLVQEHERIHIRRLDHLVKPAAFLVCCVHWFNPLVWVSFFLMERDMEASCDEAVIRKIGYDKRKDYANTLLGLSQNRGWQAGYPIAFGENHVTNRIKRVVKMKKAGIWVVAGATLLLLSAAVLLLVSRPGEHAPEVVQVEQITTQGEDSVTGGWTNVPDTETSETPVNDQEDGKGLPEKNEDVPETHQETESDVEVPDLIMQEYYTSDELLKDSNLTYMQESEGGQETIMNYDASRVRDQYETILLPQQDEAFNDLGILFSYPVEDARISDFFGSRIHPVSGDIVYHLGIDFAAQKGTPVKAAANGTVAKTGFEDGSGNYVILLHENGDATYYCQCQEILVKEGDTVTRGEQIATLGSTGKSTGAHLHFAVSRNGKYIQPEFEETEQRNPPG